MWSCTAEERKWAIKWRNALKRGSILKNRKKRSDNWIKRKVEALSENFTLLVTMLVKAFIHRFSKWHLATTCPIYELLWLSWNLRTPLMQSRSSCRKEAVMIILTLREFCISDKFGGSLPPYGDSLSRKLVFPGCWGQHDEQTDSEADLIFHV